MEDIITRYRGKILLQDIQARYYYKIYRQDIYNNIYRQDIDSTTLTLKSKKNKT